MLSLPAPFSAYVHTLTTGKEFAQHERIARALDARFFLAHPYASWERGANENMNVLIRQFFPKKMPRQAMTKKDIDFAMRRLNHPSESAWGSKHHTRYL